MTESKKGVIKNFQGNHLPAYAFRPSPPAPAVTKPQLPPGSAPDNTRYAAVVPVGPRRRRLSAALHLQKLKPPADLTYSFQDTADVAGSDRLWSNMIVGNKRGAVVGSNNNMIDRMIGFVFDHKIEKRNLDFSVELLGEMRGPS